MGQSRLFVLLLICFPGMLLAEQTKTIYNPFTGKLDYITKVDSNTLPGGSTNYIQNNPSSVQTATMTISGTAQFDQSQWSVYNATPTLSTNGQMILAFDSSAQYPCIWFQANGARYHMCGCPDGAPVNNSGQCMGFLCGVTYP